MGFKTVMELLDAADRLRQRVVKYKIPRPRETGIYGSEVEWLVAVTFAPAPLAFVEDQRRGLYGMMDAEGKEHWVMRMALKDMDLLRRVFPNLCAPVSDLLSTAHGRWQLAEVLSEPLSEMSLQLRMSAYMGDSE